MKFGITILGNKNVPEVYVWCHQTEQEAHKAANELSRKHNVEVIVFEIIGTYKPISVFEKQI